MSISQGPSTSKASSSTTTTGKLSNMSSSTFGLPTGSCISIDEMYPKGRILESPNHQIFTFNELKSATKNFMPETVLGEGGFGRVFKGWVDEKTLNPARSGLGMVVAVKKLNPERMQGLEEWQVIGLNSLVRILKQSSHMIQRILGIWKNIVYVRSDVNRWIQSHILKQCDPVVRAFNSKTPFRLLPYSSF